MVCKFPHFRLTNIEQSLTFFFQYRITSGIFQMLTNIYSFSYWLFIIKWIKQKTFKSFSKNNLGSIYFPISIRKKNIVSHLHRLDIPKWLHNTPQHPSLNWYRSSLIIFWSLSYQLRDRIIFSTSSVKERQQKTSEENLSRRDVAVSASIKIGKQYRFPPFKTVISITN